MYKKILLFLSVIYFTQHVIAADAKVMQAQGEQSDQQKPTNSNSNSSKTLEITSPWARPSMSSTGNSAAYLTIENNTNLDYKLIGASAAAIASNVELHNSFVDQTGVSRMTKIDNIIIPSGSTITLAPGKMHIMLFGLQKTLNIGDKFDLQLIFEKTDPRIIEVTVKSGN